MWQVAIVVILLLVGFMFVALNMHTTEVNFPFTKGFQVRTVLLLLVSFGLGYATAYFVRLAKDMKNRRR